MYNMEIPEDIEERKKYLLSLVSENGMMIEDIAESDITEDIQLAAVKQCGFSIRCIYEKNIQPTEEVQLAAIEKQIGSLSFIPNPSETVQLAAIKKDAYDAMMMLYKKINESA